MFNASVFADLIIAISQYSRRHFLEIFPHFPQERIVVIHPGSRFAGPSEELARPLELERLAPQGFWLSVGTLEPRKNHRRLVAAYARFKAQVGKTIPLVLAGARGWLMDGFEKHLEELGIREEVIVLGYVDDAALQWLYQNCFALMYPSLFEGFGLPVLEAMSLGTVAIASNVSSLPEIVGDASLLVDPLSEQSIAEAMARLVQQPQVYRDLKARVRQQAAGFNWKSTAQKVLECYQKALALPKLGF